jgi:hypothetical protein
LFPPAAPESLPEPWKALRDAKGACQIMVPGAWDSSSDRAGFAVLRDSPAVAVVTSQPGQAFQPLPEALLKMLGIPKERVFENSAKRVFYQDKAAATSADTTKAFSAMVPGKAGACSSRVVFPPEVPEDTARKIVLSLGPAPE